MASTASTASPPTNLKDRIAALQRLNHQNNNATSNNISMASAPTSPTSSSPSRSALKDKIAKFEKRGGTPIPRGSFGMGVPTPEDPAYKRTGELYGNRVPGLNRPTGPPTAYPKARSPSSPSSPSFSPRQRSVSTSSLDFTAVKISLDASSSTVGSTAAGKISVMEAAKDGNVSLQELGNSAARRNSVAVMRRAVSDSYGAYETPSPNSIQDDEIDGSQVLEALKNGSVAETEILYFEPEVEGAPETPPAQPSALVSGEKLFTKGNILGNAQSPDRASSKMDRVDSPDLSVDDDAPDPILAPSLQEVLDFSANEDLDLKLDVPVSGSVPNFSRRRTQPDPMSMISLESVETVTPSTYKRSISIDDRSTFDVSQAEIVTAHTGILASVSPSSSSPDPDSPPSSSRPSSPELKQNGDSQPKLRKKIYPNSGPNFQEPPIIPQQPSRKLFTATVHKKSTIRKSEEAANTSVPSITSGRARMPDPQAPDIPNTGELNRLAAEAALLEQQLGVDWSPLDDFAGSGPLFNQSIVSQSTSDDGKTGSTLSGQSVPYPTLVLKEVSEDEAEYAFISSAPAKNNSRSRKLSSKLRSLARTSTSTLRSISSSHSRPSVSREVSEDESPPATGGEVSSIHSSGSKWSLSPKKDRMSRATSFADKILNRSAKTKSAVTDDHSDINHLSPTRGSTMPRSKRSNGRSSTLPPPSSIPRIDLPEFDSSLLESPQQSARSSASSRLFDSDIFDAFPSVPKDLPVPITRSASSSALPLSQSHDNNVNRLSHQPLHNS